MRDDLPAAFRQTLDGLPELPGCYLMFAADGELLYVGKARVLRPRVRSYFQESACHPPKVAALVSLVARLDVIVTRSELEALLLENNLIKEHKPRFNVMLRDDKSFPYLKLNLADRFPRVTLVRRPRPDGSLFFGPFLPASHAWRTLRMIPRFFQVANCHAPFDGRQRPCLLFHMDQCLAPCAGLADPAEYADRVSQVKLFLEGRDSELEALIEQRMAAASAALEFERAARYRDMLASLKALVQKQGMIRIGDASLDFWAEYREADQAAVELFQMRQGRMVGRREFTLDPAPAPETFYDTVLARFYGDEDPPPEIVLPRLPHDQALIEAFLGERAGRRVRLAAPRQGEKRQLLDLVARNARLAFEARFRQSHTHGVRGLAELRDYLGLEEPPFRIEGLDVSHLQGDQPRAALVVFEGGKPKKADYRIFRLRTAGAGDDYQAVREVVGRRYSRLRREGKRLPDLVLIDGGAGQLNAALEALAGLELAALPLVSLAKREEAVFLEGRGSPLKLERGDPALAVLQRVRDEAHRFALKHHRQARSRERLGTGLTAVPGVGALTARRLLEQFGSLEGVRAASEGALAAAVGPARARKIRAALAPQARSPASGEAQTLDQPPEGGAPGEI